MPCKKLVVINKLTGEEFKFDSCQQAADHFNLPKRIMSEWLNGRLFSYTKELSSKYEVAYCETCDVSFFQTWSSEMAYFVGLIYADGNIKTQNYQTSKGLRQRHYVRLGLIDKEIIVKLKKCLKATHKIQRSYESKDRNTIYSLEIGGSKLYKIFYNLGFREAKTNLDCSIDVNPAYEDFFWAGYIDGDGSITTDRDRKGNPYLRVHVDFCEYNQTMIHKFEEWLIRNKISVHKRLLFRADLGATVNVVDYSIISKLDLEKLLNLTYYKSPLTIKRKYNKLINILKYDNRWS